MRLTLRHFLVLGLVSLSALLSSNLAGAVNTPYPHAQGSAAAGTARVAVAYDADGNVMAHRGKGSARPWVCTYHGFLLVHAVGTRPDLKHPVTPRDPQGVFIVCMLDGAEVYRQYFIYRAAEPFGAIFAAEDAAALATNSIELPLPEIHTSPPENTAQLVGLPTWLWIGNPWEPLSASATAGGVTATVTATPTTVHWNPGDGSPAFTCDGPGTAWNRARPDATSECTHTYIVRSTVDDPDGTYALTATISYDVAWTATNGQGGTLDPLTRTATIPLLVQEAQALIR